MHSRLGRYHVRDIQFTVAFDVAAGKVGQDLSDAIQEYPNNTLTFQRVPLLNVPVLRGMTHDGLGKYLADKVMKAGGQTVDVVQVLRDTKTDVVVNFLPVGSEEATKWYVEQVLQAGCAFVNCIPVFIASSSYWQSRFEHARLPVIGDDVKSQVGATIVHRMLTTLFERRGVRVDRTMQLNVGGNTDFLNMLERERLQSKKVSKTQAVTSMAEHLAKGDPDNVHVGPSDYVPWLEDRKWAYIRMEATAFGGAPLNLELKLEVWDSPNSAGVVIDAVRAAKIALDREMHGPIHSPSAWLMKSPPAQYPDDTAYDMMEQFVAASMV
jgi:myo-inositol-1-phosphate synthase